MLKWETCHPRQEDESNAYAEPISALALFPRRRRPKPGVSTRAEKSLPALHIRKPALGALMGHKLELSSVWVASSWAGPIPNWKRASHFMASSPTSR